MLSEYASFRQNLTTVPLYDTLGDEAIIHICNQTEMTIVIASNDRALNLLRLKDQISTLKTLILMDESVSEELSKQAADKNVELIKLADIEKVSFPMAA